MKIVALISHLIFGFCLGATPIMFTINATGTGTLNGIPFVNGPMVFAIGADTDSRVTFTDIPGTAFDEFPTSFAITIGGIGTVDVADSIYVFDNVSLGAFGWGTNFSQTQIETDRSVFIAPPFLTYDLLTSLGLITPTCFPGAGFPCPDSSARIPDWSRNPVNTSSGPMILTAYTGTQTITASAGTIPEPTSLFLGAVGLTAIWLSRGRIHFALSARTIQSYIRGLLP